MGSGRLPPLWLVVVTQVMSTIGDAFGQRVVRRDHKGSRRRMLLAMSVFTAVQVFVLLGVAQLVLPSSITGAIYNGSTKETCYRETDIQMRTGVGCGSGSANCTVINCPSQGPFSVWAQIGAHPELLLDQVMNILYYFNEALLYKEPLGLIFLVIASLVSSFLIAPIQSLVGLPTGPPIPPLVYVLGMGGAALALVERRGRRTPPPPPSIVGIAPPSEEDGLLAHENGGSVSVNKAANDADSAGHSKPGLWGQIHAWLSLFIPFVLLSIAYAGYFVMQRYFGHKYRMNVFSYTSLDQVLLPGSLYPFIAFVALTPGVSRVLDSGADVDEPLLVSLRAAWAELSFVNMFSYRFFLNARAMVYFYLAVSYDLSRVYLELTLTRILLSWVGSIAITLLFPKFINTTADERATQLRPFNLLFKAAGSVLILFSMLKLNHVI